MKNLFGTSPLLKDAASTVKPQNFWLVSLIFLLVYYVGNIISSVVLVVPMVVYMFTDRRITEMMRSGEIMADELYNAMMDSFPSWLNLLSLFVTAVTIAVVLFYCLKIEKRSPFSMGFHKKGAVFEYLAGLGIGFLMFEAVFLIMLASGEVTSVSFNPEASISMLVLFLLGFIIQGASEEILLRSYYFVSGGVSGGIPLAIAASAGVFALLHLANPGINPLSVVNLFLFGVFAALYFLRRGSIWGIAAIHSIWNYAQGNIFGCKVSGMDMGDSLFITVAQNNSSLFTGGAFGPEGGLGVTVVLVSGIVVLLFMKNKERIRDVKL